uniref:Gag-pol polyprotein n=1 Tax=Solanum tuberosum TaxID=4113 RepID=M1DSR9_SOLTU
MGLEENGIRVTGLEEKRGEGMRDIPPRRANTRRNMGDNVEPEVLQVLIDPLVEQVSHAEFQAAFQMLAQDMTTQVGRKVVSLVNPIVGMVATKFNKDRVSNPKSQGGGGSGPFIPSCQKCGKSHSRKCLAGTNIYNGYRKSGHKNRFYALQTRYDHEGSLDVVTGMLKVFHFDVYALLDPRATLYFVTPYVAMGFDVVPKILLETFLVSTHIGESIVAKRVCRNCLVLVSQRVTHVDLVEVDMLDFDVILEIDCLHFCYASIYCRIRLVTFQISNKPILKWKEGNLAPKDQFISYLKARKMISKGCIYHLVRFRYTKS